MKFFKVSFVIFVASWMSSSGAGVRSHELSNDVTLDSYLRDLEINFKEEWSKLFGEDNASQLFTKKTLMLAQKISNATLKYENIDNLLDLDRYSICYKERIDVQDGVNALDFEFNYNQNISDYINHLNSRSLKLKLKEVWPRLLEEDNVSPLITKKRLILIEKTLPRQTIRYDNVNQLVELGRYGCHPKRINAQDVIKALKDEFKYNKNILNYIHHYQNIKKIDCEWLKMSTSEKLAEPIMMDQNCTELVTYGFDYLGFKGSFDAMRAILPDLQMKCQNVDPKRVHEMKLYVDAVSCSELHCCTESIRTLTSTWRWCLGTFVEPFVFHLYSQLEDTCRGLFQAKARSVIPEAALIAPLTEITAEIPIRSFPFAIGRLFQALHKTLPANLTLEQQNYQLRHTFYERIFYLCKKYNILTNIGTTEDEVYFSSRSNPDDIQQMFFLRKVCSKIIDDQERILGDIDSGNWRYYVPEYQPPTLSNLLDSTIKKTIKV